MRMVLHHTNPPASWKAPMSLATRPSSSNVRNWGEAVRNEVAMVVCGEVWNACAGSDGLQAARVGVVRNEVDGLVRHIPGQAREPIVNLRAEQQKLSIR